jgi:hypothetical protein
MIIIIIVGSDAHDHYGLRLNSKFRFVRLLLSPRN